MVLRLGRRLGKTDDMCVAILWFAYTQYNKGPNNQYDIIIATPYEECLRRNTLSKQKVPDEVIEAEYKKWAPPHYSEGFDLINIVFPFNFSYYTIDLF